MADGADQVLSFHAAVAKNRQIFLLQYPFAHFAFFGLVEYADRIGRRLQVGRDANGKTHVSLIPFLLLLQRQAMNAFDALASCRSYEAWVLFRPALESALIMGKWVDDKENAAIWSARHARKTEYIKAYSGKGLISVSLPGADRFHGVLTRLNDEFVHANEPYYDRHTSLTNLADGDLYLRVDFFDDGEDVEAHATALLHLLATILDAVDSMLARTLPATGEHAAVAPRLSEELKARAGRLARSDRHRAALTDLGLWADLAV